MSSVIATKVITKKMALALTTLLLIGPVTQTNAQSNVGIKQISFNEQRGMHKIGSGTLSWLGFDVYTATYYTDLSGNEIEKEFPGWQLGKRATLELTYHRKISTAQLISATQKIWKKMGIKLASEEDHIQRLYKIWPGVNKNDTLTLRINENGVSDFYINNRYLGSIESSEFSLAFISIWTAQETPNQELRNNLLGFNKYLNNT